MCYLPQDHFLPGHFSILNCVKSYLSSNKIDPFFDDPFLNDVKNSKVFHLSGGELRYLEVKLLLHTDCKFVLLDEPFSGVAPLMTKQIQKIITEKAGEKGILLTDHDYASVLSVATSYRLLHDGALNKLKSQHELVEWGYVSQSKLQQHP